MRRTVKIKTKSRRHGAVWTRRLRVGRATVPCAVDDVARPAIPPPTHTHTHTTTTDPPTTNNTQPPDRRDEPQFQSLHFGGLKTNTSQIYLRVLCQNMRAYRTRHSHAIATAARTRRSAWPAGWNIDGGRGDYQPEHGDGAEGACLD